MTHPIHEVLQRIGVPGQPSAVAVGNTWQTGAGEQLTKVSPINGETLVTMHEATLGDVGLAVDIAKSAFLKWRQVPAPRRGEFVRLIGDIDCQTNVAKSCFVHCDQCLSVNGRHFRQLLAGSCLPGVSHSNR